MTRHQTSWRLVPLSWLDLVTLACRTASTASEYFAADHADIAAFKAAEASGRIAATDADATPASVAEEILHVLVLSNGFTGHNRTSFLTDVLRAFARANGLTTTVTTEDARAVLAFELLGSRHHDAGARAEARTEAAACVRRVLLTNSDTADWTDADLPRPLPEAVVLSPMRSTRDQDERARCDDLVLMISAEIQRRTGWNVHPCALIERHDDRFGTALANEHDALVAAAQAVYVVATPASFGVGWAARGIPAGVPRVYLAERGTDLSHVVEPAETAYWSTERELLEVVDEFADSLLQTAPVARPASSAAPAAQQPLSLPREATHLIGGEPQRPQRPPRRRRTPAHVDDFLPGLDDTSFLGEFQMSEPHLDPSTTDMRRVLQQVEWRDRKWLAESEFDAARAAKKRFGWDDTEFNDAVAFMTMTRAYEHFAPQMGIRTRRRNAATEQDWERIRHRRRRQR